MANAGANANVSQFRSVCRCDDDSCQMAHYYACMRMPESVRDEIIKAGMLIKNLGQRGDWCMEYVGP
jgi:hypothetical protein